MEWRVQKSPNERSASQRNFGAKKTHRITNPANFSLERAYSRERLLTRDATRLEGSHC
jgi:hypothetical protein